ncbi:bifunctional precorrin-2 dehydrogenase/sirohydrochlorin ferrochelatase [Eubacteriaceae bacterium ES2]|nr:bifunctional precorrin-2 dehydrogenase/sirohydrochlorin ferrochelatase [Eubacteriaceae bacterium ES2]
MIPLLFSLKSRKILVVGGGEIASRRVLTLLSEGGQVICVSTEFSEKLKSITDMGLELKQKKYERADLSGINLAVAATANGKINELVRQDCKSLGILCNRVDCHEDSDFIFPSTLRRGDLSISVCTEGASPTLTKKIIRSLKVEYDDSYGRKVELLKSLRQIVLTRKQIDLKTRETLNQLADCSVSELEKKLDEYNKTL